MVGDGRRVPCATEALMHHLIQETTEALTRPAYIHQCLKNSLVLSKSLNVCYASASTQCARDDGKERERER